MAATGTGARHAFTMVEIVMSVLIVGGLLAVLIPMAERARNGSGLEVSLNNLRQILAARAQYSDDHAGQIPMRGCRYVNGQISGGWDTWSFGGKDNDASWQTRFGGAFDQSAYSRPLNPYLTPMDIPEPPGYLNTGAGLNWNFHPGTPTAEQRNALEIPVFRSPGDTGTRQRDWPHATPGVSGYDDVGTSYMVNMQWWDQIVVGSFTARFNDGVSRIRLAAAMPPPSLYVWVHDQVGGVVPATFGTTFRGEFGGPNRSALGFLDGRADYLRLTFGASSGPGYTFWP